uniref:Uncharacterized protein n=1 Tax=Rhizophora mucronata TaxID=61149 RepID=A0A2P2PI45_RHIMU
MFRLWLKSLHAFTFNFSRRVVLKEQDTCLKVSGLLAQCCLLYICCSPD